jgi:hypothetical protein
LSALGAKEVVLVNTDEDVAPSISKLLGGQDIDKLSRDSQIILGMDIEVRPTFKKAFTHPVNFKFLIVKRETII